MQADKLPMIRLKYGLYNSYDDLVMRKIK